MQLGASRFVAGETLDEWTEALRALNKSGLRTITTILGEWVTDEITASVVVDAYTKVLDRIAKDGLNSNVALKLTHLLLDAGEEGAFRNVEQFVAHAATHGNFIRIDMEESARVDATLRTYQRLHEDGHENVGTVLQSFLYRTDRNLTDHLPLAPNLRLVKGTYVEPESVSFPQKSDVDVNCLKLAERMPDNCLFIAIATHDGRIIERVIEMAKERGLGHDRF